MCRGPRFASATVATHCALRLQAAIAAVHVDAASAEDTDWPQILALYGLLERMSGHYRLDAVRAHFYDMLGDNKAAAAHYRAAARRTTNLPERHYLTRQSARLNAD